MNDDRLEKLLRQADTMAGPPCPPATDLAHRVMRSAARRRLVRTGSACAASILLVLIGSAWLMRSGAARGPTIAVQPPSPEEIKRLRTEMEALGREADSRTEVIRRVAAWQRQAGKLAELQRQANQPDPLEESRGQVEKAAFLMYCDARRLCRDPDTVDRCVAVCRRIVELFPQTAWGQVARQQLIELEGSKGETS